jgi:hypothetical protein
MPSWTMRDPIEFNGVLYCPICGRKDTIAGVCDGTMPDNWRCRPITSEQILKHALHRPSRMPRPSVLIQLVVAGALLLGSLGRGLVFGDWLPFVLYGSGAAIWYMSGVLVMDTWTPWR